MENFSNLAMIAAAERGFTISRDGKTVIGGHGRPLKLQISKNTRGYFVFYIRIGKKNKQIRAHRFQAYHKFGDKIFEKGICVRHMNGIRTDNSWENIEIGTQAENLKDMPRSQMKILNGNKCKLPPGKVEELKKYRIDNKCTYEAAGKAFGICTSRAWHLINETDKRMVDED